MLPACLPFGPVVTSNETFCPSLSALKPCMLIAEKCANRSLPPPSGVIKQKPFASLNHFTVPFAIGNSLGTRTPGRLPADISISWKVRRWNDWLAVAQSALYCLDQNTLITIHD